MTSSFRPAFSSTSCCTVLCILSSAAACTPCSSFTACSFWVVTCCSAAAFSSSSCCRVLFILCAAAACAAASSSSVPFLSFCIVWSKSCPLTSVAFFSSLTSCTMADTAASFSCTACMASVSCWVCSWLKRVNLSCSTSAWSSSVWLPLWVACSSWPNVELASLIFWVSLSIVVPESCSVFKLCSTSFCDSVVLASSVRKLSKRSSSCSVWS
mmetsp:Transcript_7888/g.19881  ORF Transcript_7888/g.19881 Transcript_7888/m.19881 type:complete len:212 (-) Transcript_7888:441-1076(-)